MSIYFNGKRYIEHKFKLESEFESEVYSHADSIFGPNVILLDSKKKIDSGELGRAIPDGFLFDFADPEDPKFYLIEVELQSHDFYRHIFPQITKFFAFLRANSSEQAKLVDSLYRVIESDSVYKAKFNKYLKGKELFKFLKDLIEESADILLIIDGKKTEIDEIKLVYAETWGKYVKLMECSVFINENASIVLCNPDFEIVEAGADVDAQAPEDQDKSDVAAEINEDYHLSDASPSIREMFQKLKVIFPNSEFNCQKYYISIRDTYNFAYVMVRKKALRFVILMPLDEAKGYISHYHLREPSAGVMRFYNARCTEVKVSDPNYFDEILSVLKVMQTYEIKRIR